MLFRPWPGSSSLSAPCSPSLCTPSQGGDLAILDSMHGSAPAWIKKFSPLQAMLLSQDQGIGLAVYREGPHAPVSQFVSMKWDVLSEQQWPWGSMWEDAGI